MILLVNPRLVVQSNDTLTTGIVYMPISLALLAGAIEASSQEYEVLDLFGMNPKKCEISSGRWIFGENFVEVLSRRVKEPEHLVVFANQASNHAEIMSLVRITRENMPNVKVSLLENSQAVTAYSLGALNKDLRGMGVAHVLRGNPDSQIKEFHKHVLGLTPSEARPKSSWDKFPLENYWNYKLSHGPQTAAKFLPILSSFGCPWACSFCVIPATNNRKWVGILPEQVAEEVAYLKKRWGVSEFHFEDLNPSVDSKRLEDLARLLKHLGITWKIVAGTKAETMKSLKMLSSLKESGLSYFSFSPESGSPKVRKAIGKRFDIWHSLRLIWWSKRLEIRTQACFVLGMPTERWPDRFLSLTLIRIYTILGLDEIAVFIISPIPGSSLHDNMLTDLENISFSPKWRSDYRRLLFTRLYWYFNFLLLKVIFHPIMSFKTLMNFIQGTHHLKMELAPWRSLQWKRWKKGSIAQKRV